MPVTFQITDWNDPTLEIINVTGGLEGEAFDNETSNGDTAAASGSSSNSTDYLDGTHYESTAEKVYAFIQIPSSLLSLSCSIFIIQHVVRTKLLRSTPNSTRRRGGKESNTFPRILIGLCLFDSLSSLTLALEPLVVYAVPKPFAGHWTCDLGGFTLLTGICCSSFYNSALSLYYYLLINRNWKDNDLLKRFEPPVHTVIFLAIIWLGIGIPLQAYNPFDALTMDCWPRAYPPFCISGGDPEAGIPACTRGEPWGWYYDYFATSGFLMCLLIILSTNIAIYCNVRKLLARNERYQPNNNRTSTIDSSRTSNVTMSNRTSIDSSRTSNVTMSNRMSTSSSSAASSKSKSPMNRNKKREVAHQSFLYCAGYLGVYLITFVHDVTGIADDPEIHGTWWYHIIRTLVELTFPMQGFFNVLVYLRPKYIEWREIQLYRDGVPSRWRALKEALMTKPFPLPSSKQAMKRRYLQLLRQQEQQHELEQQRRQQQQQEEVQKDEMTPPQQEEEQKDEMTPQKQKLDTLEETSAPDGEDDASQANTENDMQSNSLGITQRSGLLRNLTSWRSTHHVVRNTGQSLRNITAGWRSLPHIRVPPTGSSMDGVSWADSSLTSRWEESFTSRTLTSLNQASTTVVSLLDLESEEVHSSSLAVAEESNEIGISPPTAMTPDDAPTPSSSSTKGRDDAMTRTMMEPLPAMPEPAESEEDQDLSSDTTELEAMKAVLPDSDTSMVPQPTAGTMESYDMFLNEPDDKDLSLATMHNGGVGSNPSTTIDTVLVHSPRTLPNAATLVVPDEPSESMRTGGDDMDPLSEATAANSSDPSSTTVEPIPEDHSITTSSTVGAITNSNEDDDDEVFLNESVVRRRDHDDWEDNQKPFKQTWRR